MGALKSFIYGDSHDDNCTVEDEACLLLHRCMTCILLFYIYKWKGSPPAYKNYGSITNLERIYHLSKCTSTMGDLAEKHYDDGLPTSKHWCMLL